MRRTVTPPLHKLRPTPGLQLEQGPTALDIVSVLNLDLSRTECNGSYEKDSVRIPAVCKIPLTEILAYFLNY